MTQVLQARGDPKDAKSKFTNRTVLASQFQQKTLKFWSRLKPEVLLNLATWYHDYCVKKAMNEHVNAIDSNKKHEIKHMPL